MDFFEAQARAQRRTSRLLVLFGMAVAGTVLAAYAAAVWLLGWTGVEKGSRTKWEPWQPDLLMVVGSGTLLLVGGASLYKWRSYSAGGGAVAEGLGARRLEPASRDLAERRLLNVVEEMAIASGTPVPAVYVLDEEAGINAFAAGLTPRDAVVAVTRGTLEKLDRDELQGVVAHEFSHILNGDMRLNLRIAATVFGILVLGLAGRGILASLRHTRVRSKEKGAGGVIVAVGAAGLALMVIGYVGYFFGRLIQAAVSRQREFLADASAVQFTRNPAGISGALRKIGADGPGSRLQATRCAEIGHLFFAQGFRFTLAGLWATHPPLEERIRAIDSSFDGTFPTTPKSADAITGSAESAPGTGAPLAQVGETAGFASGGAESAMAGIGSLRPEHLAGARALIEGTPEELREAAHAPAEAIAVILGLLMSDETGVRNRQEELLRAWPEPGVLARVAALRPRLAGLGPEHKLPVLEMALPAVRQLPRSTVPGFLAVLESLVEADGRMSTFEFALQKLVRRALTSGHVPRRTDFTSLHALRHELSVLLSAMASRVDRDPIAIARAFARGAATLQPVTPELRLVTQADEGLAALDLALDRLAGSSPAIKQRALRAAAHCATEDGRMLPAEAQLLRAVAATLDCPMPLLGT